MCGKKVRKKRLSLAILLAVGGFALTADATETRESIPLPRARPLSIGAPVPSEKPIAEEAGPQTKPLDAVSAVPLPRERPDRVEVAAADEPVLPPVPVEKPAEAAAPLPAEKPAEAAAPFPEEKPEEADTSPPVPEEKPAEAAPPLPAERPEDDPAVTSEPATPAADELQMDTPKEPLFAEDAMSPACAAVEEGAVSGRPLKPIEDPAGCVVPAVYAISSVGTERAVALTPEAEVNCAMAARLDLFVEEVIEPAARDILDSELTDLGIAGSYVCRTRNGIPGAEPSEHGKANAIDISSFSLADGRVITVTGDWVSDAADDDEDVEGGSEEEEVSDEPVEESDAADDSGSSAEPEDEALETAEPREDTPAAIFLREIHAKACGPFTTVIGPEGDEHHQDHFHFDLQPRGANGRTTFCQ